MLRAVFALFFVFATRSNRASAALAAPSAAGTGVIRELNHPNQITSLPGLQGELPSRQFSGYVHVEERSRRRLYYWLVESERDPAADPLILWLTGGPGCSSLDALTYENGPFVFRFRQDVGPLPSAADVVLERNPNTWAAVASVLYVDSPAGTGMSYTAGSRQYDTDDAQTIEDLVTFLAGFYDLHPEWRSRELYIAGESYGGVYVPSLASRLVLETQQSSAAASPAAAADGAGAGAATPSAAPPAGSGLYGINLVGYLVGNAVTDDFYDNRGQVDFAYGMGLIPPDTYQEVHTACQGHFANPRGSKGCSAALDAMADVIGDVNPYSILDPCTWHHHNSSAAPAAGRLHRPQRQRFNGRQRQLLGGAGSGGASRGAGDVGRLGHTVACADRSHALLWYNDPQVRRAIHAAPIEESGRWEPCSDVLNFRFTAGSMLPVHSQLLRAGLRGLVLSGDHDYIVPFTGTRAWVYSLELRQQRAWHPWRMPDHQVAGYAVTFEGGLTFATVKGAGHMVPQTRPQASLQMLQLWLGGAL